MKIFAIGDLHLSGSVDKPMNVFGDHWDGHDRKIFEDWSARVTDEDVVLVVGDISWASKLRDAQVDLDQIDRMPGKKYFIRGNHDYWWTTATALNKLYGHDMVFMNTNFHELGGYALCGTRGWLSPNEVKFDDKDEVIYKREAKRLELSLEGAKKAGYEDYIVILHYPPTNEKFESSLYMDVINKYKPRYVIYGHLHGKESFDAGLKGIHDGVSYHLVSCDYLDFKLSLIEDLSDS